MTTPLKIMLIAFAAGVGSAACTQPATVDTAPIGSDVQVTRQDGALVEGKLKARTDRAVTVETRKATREVPRAQVADVRVVDPARPEPAPPAAKFREYTVPAGTKLALTVVTPLHSESSRVEDRVEATLTAAAMVDGVEVLPAGAVVRGVVSAVEPAGKVRGRASLSVRFSEVRVGAEAYPLDARFGMTAASTRKDDAMKIGIPAAGGAIIGAIIGGKKGAAIGTAVGGGGGAAVVMTTPGDPVSIARGAAMSITLDKAIEVRVPIARP